MPEAESPQHQQARLAALKLKVRKDAICAVVIFAVYGLAVVYNLSFLYLGVTIFLMAVWRIFLGSGSVVPQTL